MRQLTGLGLIYVIVYTFFFIDNTQNENRAGCYLFFGKLSLMNFSGETISWFRSYLCNRTFLVNAESLFSENLDA